MPIRSINLKQLSVAVLLPLIGFVPFLILLRRDFIAFQQFTPQVAATTQGVPWTWERAIAALVAIICLTVGIHRLAYQSFSPSDSMASNRSWGRLIFLVAYMVFLFSLIY